MRPLAFLAFCTFLAACRTEAPAAHEAGRPDADFSFVFADASPSPAPSASASAAPLAPVVPESRLAAYANATPTFAKSVGHTSVVFRVDFVAGSAGGGTAQTSKRDAGRLRAAVKPESKRGHRRFRGEVAAYRLSKLLGLPNVLPAEVRIFSRAELRAAAAKDARALSLFDDEVVDRKGRVFASLVPWLDHLEFIPLESPAERGHWEKELRHGEDVPADRRALDAQISNLVVFDTLEGNWDRWSGANVGIDKASGMLLFVDNDGAFFDTLPKLFKQQMAEFRGVDRFSRSLVARLRAISALDLADAFGDEEPGTPLLPARVVADCEGRRKDILAAIDKKIAQWGEADVLYFP